MKRHLVSVRMAQRCLVAGAPQECRYRTQERSQRTDKSGHYWSGYAQWQVEAARITKLKSKFSGTCMIYLALVDYISTILSTTLGVVKLKLMSVVFRNT